MWKEGNNTNLSDFLIFKQVLWQSSKQEGELKVRRMWKGGENLFLVT